MKLRWCRNVAITDRMSDVQRTSSGSGNGEREVQFSTAHTPTKCTAHKLLAHDTQQNALHAPRRSFPATAISYKMSMQISVPAKSMQIDERLFEY